MGEQFLTIPDVATLLKLGQRSIYKLAREGRIARYRQGRRSIALEKGGAEGGRRSRGASSVTPTANLPEPHILAEEIADDLRASLQQIEGVLADLQLRANGGAP